VDLAFEDRKLVPQGQDLQGELVLGTEPGQKVAQERGDNREHGPLACGQIQQNQRLRSVTNFLPPTGHEHARPFGPAVLFAPFHQGPEGNLDQQSQKQQLGEGPKPNDQIGQQTSKEDLQQCGTRDSDFQP
jgi:hypothetical protein